MNLHQYFDVVFSLTKLSCRPSDGYFKILVWYEQKFTNQVYLRRNTVLGISLSEIALIIAKLFRWIQL